jgi:predicted metal-dependent enzyme (double-stranded beta helix superfamily)
MFDLERFIEDCRTAVAEDPSHKAVREVVARAVSAPGEVLKAVGEPKRGEAQTLYRSNEVTILNIVWAPWMTVLPHNHNRWAVIGIYTGREDNIFWRRVPDAPDGRVEAAGAKAICERDAVPLGRDIIHSVTNPIPRLTGALHVYGGDFFDVSHRSQWEPDTLRETPYDMTRTVRIFEEANRFLAQS